ncbi:MAG: hypothetical protein JW797_10115 [Bradymonadales bacterium]|nr:hypothetical protein [Bradymonadales bacterium]
MGSPDDATDLQRDDAQPSEPHRLQDWYVDPERPEDRAIRVAPAFPLRSFYRYLTRITCPEDYSVLQGEGTDLKYLLPIEGQPPREPLTEDCYFQNTSLYPWHIQFLNSFAQLAALSFDEYVSLMLYAATRIWWGGDLQIHSGAIHPISGQAGVISYLIYSSEADGLTVEQIVQVDATLKNCMPYGGEMLVFVPSGPRQEFQLRGYRDQLTGQGVASLFPSDLTRGLSFIPYSLGEGYGYLKVVPQGSALDEYGPRDVVIVESAPNDISIVAGLVTANPQSLHSHVNLRLQEKQIPNVSIPNIYSNALVLSLAGSLVRLLVTETEATIAPARIEDAEAFWAAHQPHVSPVQYDLSVTALASFSQLGYGDAPAYGAKAANLGEIYRLLPEEHRQAGVAIPFHYYHQFVEQNGIGDQIRSFLDNPLSRTDADFRREGLDDIRDRIRDGRLDQVFFNQLRTRLTEVLSSGVPTEPLRFRSSTNVEDLDQFTGAGLYDSRRGCLADDLDADDLGPSACLSQEEAAYLAALLTARQQEVAQHPERTWLLEIIEDLQGDLHNEKTVARAIRRVWASLWNEQAFNEREYYGVNHLEAFMGIAVHPSFVMERVNAVALTNLTPDAGPPLYRVASQVGWETVVRPADPTAIPEILTFRRQGNPPEPTEIQWVVESSLVSPGEHLWSHEDLTLLGTLLFSVQDHFAAEVYPQISPLRLDVEIEVTEEGQVVVKQVRPYVGWSF